MEDKTHDILSRLKGVKRSGNGWTAFCPCHEDKHRSLSIFIGKDGHRIFLKCHAGCLWPDVFASIGLKKNGNFTVPSYYKPEKELEEKPDFESILKRCREDTLTPRLEKLSKLLGVSIDSLKRLGFKWHEAHKAWAIPMRDGTGKIVGIRLRAEDGKKWAIKGSENGLFIPSDLSGEGPICFCEGPTDNLALLDLGYPVIGRANCNSGISFITMYLRQFPKREVIIFSNRDEKKIQKNGGILLPGQDGAVKLAQEIYRPVKIILPPFNKDFRIWINEGCTKTYLDLVIKNTRYFARKR